jgi:hypothetical protein
MTNSIKKIASYVYGAGILTNALLSIHDENLKIEYAKQCKFPEINKGEDHDYSKKLYELLKDKTETYIDSPIYIYDFRSSK